MSEVVKQGTISGPVLCGAEMDRVNKSDKRVKASYGPNYNIGMPGFVDDLSAGGSKEDVVDAIRCCRELERRKVTYNQGFPFGKFGGGGQDSPPTWGS